MSRLKHMSLKELEKELFVAEKYQKSLRQKLVGQQTKIQWIKKYIDEKSVKEGWNG